MRWLGAALAMAAGVGGAVPLAHARVSSDRFWTDARQRRVHHERSLLSEVARKAMPAVAAITTKQPPAADSSSADGQQDTTGLGAGFVIQADGYILTSAHVIDGATEIKVSLPTPSGVPREYPARVVGEDKPTDFALLKIDPERKLPILKLGTSADVDIADWVVVIGNPFGLAHSVTVGVVSYKGRTDINPTGTPGYFDYMQTDASINPGNSGGPILDLHGEVVAIANAVNISGQGIGFGIPIDVAKAILPQLKEHGVVTRGWLGLSVQDLTPDLADIFHARSAGVLVAEISPGSPAWDAGLMVGDVITRVDGVSVSRAQSLRWRVANKGLGRAVSFHVLRDGRPFNVHVHLTEPPPSEVKITAAALPIGAAVDDVDAAASQTAGLASPFGALIKNVRPGSVIANAGVSGGDIVLKVNRWEIANKDEFIRSLKEIATGDPVRLFIRRGAKTLLFEFRKP